MRKVKMQKVEKSDGRIVLFVVYDTALCHLLHTSWESISGLNPQVWDEIAKMNLDVV